MTLAYLVAADARQPRLRFHTEPRAAVETVGAAIGLAETTLVLDANGAYRAQQVLRVDNSTEQFLEIRLPEGAALWTARVAGEPVKPIAAAPGAAELARRVDSADQDGPRRTVLRRGLEIRRVDAGARHAGATSSFHWSIARTSGRT